MADTAVAITAGSGTNIDTRTEGTNGNHRQVMVIGDPDTNAGVAPVDATLGLGVRVIAGATNIAKAEDVAAADADVGVPAMAVRQAAPAASSGSDGDYEFLKVFEGKLWTLALQPQVTLSTDITRPSDTTAYAVNDALSNSTSAPTSGGFTLTGAARVSGGSGLITDMIITSSNNAATTLQGEIWIFDTSVTNINDNAAFAISDAEVKTCVAKVPFVLVADTNNSLTHIQNLGIGFTCVGSADLRYLVKVKNVYTPASAEVITVRAKIMHVN